MHLKHSCSKTEGRTNMLFGSRASSPAVRTRRLAALAGVLASGSLILPGMTTPAVASGPAAAISWQACPQYSDAVLGALGVTSGQIGEFRDLWARTDCGTVSVPLDYQHPGGPHITIAVTRLKAADPARRLGSLAVNPGGPGASGYLLPIQLLLWDPGNARLNDRYDLIGFDPRGVGYSTKVDCPPTTGVPGPPGPKTRQWFQQYYDHQVKQNQVCAAQDPGFLSQLTTANVARDLDQIRLALHQPAISYLGLSWGTELGAVYRSLFPATVARMWLDSVLTPDTRADVRTDANVAAQADDFARMARWIAQHDDSYGLGASGAQVVAAVRHLHLSYDAAPRTFTDLPAAIDGHSIARLATVNTRQWPLAAQALAELRDATGPTAPPAVKQFFAASTPPAPPGTPEQQNLTMNQATSCNEATGPDDADSAWAAFQRRLAEYPVVSETAISELTQVQCAGWPLSAPPVRLRAAGGSLEMSGHRYEAVTPYPWAQQMQAAIGGTLFTVKDDVHSSTLRVPDCADHVIGYFDTGRRDGGQCAGEPRPSALTGTSTR
jgi:pimeloyl-ACP methyl ester carboxylesterase